MTDDNWFCAVWIALFVAIGATASVIAVSDNAWRSARDAKVSQAIAAGMSPVAAGCAFGTATGSVCALAAAQEARRP